MGRRHRSGYYEQAKTWATNRETAAPKTPDVSGTPRMRKMGSCIYFPIYEPIGSTLKLEYSISAFELFKTLTGYGNDTGEAALKWGSPTKHTDAPKAPRGFKPFQIHMAKLKTQGTRKTADKSKRVYVNYSPTGTAQFTATLPITEPAQNPRAVLANFAAIAKAVETTLGTSGDTKVPIRLTDESMPDSYEAEAGAPPPPAADPASSAVL